MKKNVVQARSFAEMLEQSVRKYQNRAIEAAQVIDELIRLAKEMREAQSRGQELGLSDDEVAFYDALADNESAKEVMGDDRLRSLAQELVERVKQNVSIDWQVRENARAQIRVLVKRVLRKFGYPPDMQQRATELVLEQAEVLCKDWSEAPLSEEGTKDEEYPSEGKPFVRVDPTEKGKYVTCVPLYSLKAAAGSFGDVQSVEPEGWVQVKTGRKLQSGMFVAQVVGRSMEPAIPEGAWCLFRAPVEGTRQGKTVLVQLRDTTDPETGQRYTVKRYESEKNTTGDTCYHTKINLKPVNPEFKPIVLTGDVEGELLVIAEVVEVLSEGA